MFILTRDEFTSVTQNCCRIDVLHLTKLTKIKIISQFGRHEIGEWKKDKIKSFLHKWVRWVLRCYNYWPLFCFFWEILMDQWNIFIISTFLLIFSKNIKQKIFKITFWEKSLNENWTQDTVKFFWMENITIFSNLKKFFFISLRFFVDILFS